MEAKPQPKSDEFRKFEDLTRQLVSVPKDEIKKQEKKATKSAPRKKRS